MQAAAPPVPLHHHQQQQHAQPPQPLPSARGGEAAGGAGGSSGGGKSQHHHHHQTTTHAARISEAVAKDLAALSNPDVSSPFASADDAVDRLLPYHVREKRRRIFLLVVEATMSDLVFCRRHFFLSPLFFFLSLTSLPSLLSKPLNKK